MSRIAWMTALAAFGLAPAIGWADCGGAHDDAAAAAPAKMAVAPAPAASRMPGKVAKPTLVSEKKVAAKTATKQSSEPNVVAASLR